MKKLTSTAIRNALKSVEADAAAYEFSGKNAEIWPADSDEMERQEIIFGQVCELLGSKGYDTENLTIRSNGYWIKLDWSGYTRTAAYALSAANVD